MSVSNDAIGVFWNYLNSCYDETKEAQDALADLLEENGYDELCTRVKTNTGYKVYYISKHYEEIWQAVSVNYKNHDESEVTKADFNKLCQQFIAVKEFGTKLLATTWVEGFKQGAEVQGGSDAYIFCVASFPQALVSYLLELVYSNFRMSEDLVKMRIVHYATPNQEA